MGILCLFSSKAQENYDEDYVPKKYFSELSFNLIRSITIQGGQQILSLDKDEKHMDQYFATTTLDLIDLVKREKFIDDDSLKAFLHSIIKKINYNNNIKVPRRILVLRSDLVNAYSLGEGTLIVSNGLLSQVDNEEQLAFIIAHEMAHWELDHFKDKINQSINAQETYNPEKEMKNISKGNFSVDGIRNIKSWHYDRKRFSRFVEYQADSLAVILFQNAYGKDQNIVHALHKLDSGTVQNPYKGARIFKDLSFDKYPFRKEWALMSAEKHIDPSNYSPFDPDSSLTHPEIERRIGLIEKMLGENGELGESDISPEYFKIKTDAKFENIESSYANFNFPMTLYYGLRLKSQYPNNSYLVEVITKVLVELHNLKKIKELEKHAKDTIGYNTEQMYVYNFVNNTEFHELAELSFHFVNKKGNFNSEDEEHYMLLFEICGLTDRYKIQELVRKRYREKFEKGKYLAQMSDVAN